MGTNQENRAVGNTAEMGFRFSGNTAGSKGHKSDGRTEVLSNKTA